MINFNVRMNEFPEDLKYLLTTLKKPNIFSSAKDKYICNLVVMWFNDVNIDKEKIENELRLVTSLHWKDFKSFSTPNLNKFKIS